LLLLLERLTFKVADYSIATNHSYRQIAIERGQMPSDRVTVVRSGPSLERMKKVAGNLKWKHGRKYLVGYVGVMGAQEGIDHLIEAVRFIVSEKKRQDIQFVLIGDGTMREKLEHTVGGLNLNSYITFTGRVSDDLLVEILNTADICVNPDIANDMNDKSTMNKIMEYMALGKPIVQYDLKEGRYSAQKASLYAKKNDPKSLAENMIQLIDDPELRNTMGRYGENRVRTELHWGIESSKYLKVYEKIFTGG
jgi:glycosyltransferase involved in cell wall biosynthesis